MHYEVPCADDLPALGCALRSVPCRSKAFGVKGVGEAGTTASLAAVMNAIADALPQAAPLDMPAALERVLQAIRKIRPHITRPFAEAPER
jgi:carbon-monoxide dehydrogenase large subunit